MKNKKGWLRIMEAVVAIMILSGVILVVYSKQAERIDVGSAVYDIQKQLLVDVSLNDSLRNYVLNKDESSLQKYMDSKIPSYLDSKVKICELTEDITPCKLDEASFLTIKDKSIFAEETIIAANFSSYSPKKVVLFVWESSGE